MRPAAVTALLGLVLGLTAATFDAEPLYVPAAAFVLLAAGAVAWVHLGARGLLIERRVSSRRAIEDDTVRIDIHIRTRSLALPAGLVEDPLLPAPASIGAGRRTAHVIIDARFTRRGRKRLVAPSVVVRDPFGLATRVVEGTGEAEVLVLPRVSKVLTPHGDGDGVGLAARGRPSVAAEIDLDGLRPHRPGAPASRMYWPALARTGELLERRLRADTDTRPLVVLDPRGAREETALDAAVRATASLAVHLAHEGGCALLLPGDRRPTVLEPTLSAWEHVHARLAVVTGSLAPSLAGLATRRGPVFYVAASSPQRPPRALSHAPGGGRVLIVPGTMPGRRAAFTVAGCTGYELSPHRSAAAVA